MAHAPDNLRPADASIRYLLVVLLLLAQGLLLVALAVAAPHQDGRPASRILWLLPVSLAYVQIGVVAVWAVLARGFWIVRVGLLGLLFVALANLYSGPPRLRSTLPPAAVVAVSLLLVLRYRAQWQLVVVGHSPRWEPLRFGVSHVLGATALAAVCFAVGRRIEWGYLRIMDEGIGIWVAFSFIALIAALLAVGSAWAVLATRRRWIAAIGTGSLACAAWLGFAALIARGDDAVGYALLLAGQLLIGTATYAVLRLAGYRLERARAAGSADVALSEPGD